MSGRPLDRPLPSRRAGRPLPPPAPRSAGDELAPMICRQIFEELTVLANGDIVCSSSDIAGQRVYGNVFVDRIADVFAGRMYREMREWQLRSKPDTWCPAIAEHCPRRVTRATPFDRPEGRSVRVLKLEPTTHCNLACPACPVVTHFPTMPALRDGRAHRLLPVETMLDVVRQLPELEEILYFNYGEPFLHKGTLRFLRELKSRRPHVRVGTNTHGLTLPPPVIDALAREALIDKIVFSIDGTFPESYRKYRVGGELETALRNLEALVRACREAGTRERVEIVWQYIFFEWNDSDEEITRARELAERIGVPLLWVMTRSAGRSQRIVHGSPEFARLTDGADSFAAMHKPLQLLKLHANGGIAEGRYLAGVSLAASPRVPDGTRAAFGGGLPVLRARARTPIVLPLRVANLAKRPWLPDRPDGAFRLGVLLRSALGRTIRELPIHHDGEGRYPFLPAAATIPGGSAPLEIVVTAPEQAGRYQLLIDVVEEGVCWFSERGSQPLACELEIAPALETQGCRDGDASSPAS